MYLLVVCNHLFILVTTLEIFSCINLGLSLYDKLGSVNDIQNTLLVSGMLLTIIAFFWSSIRESKYIRAQSKRKERKAILDIIKGYKPVSANPDVVEFRKHIVDAITERDFEDDV